MLEDRWEMQQQLLTSCISTTTSYTKEFGQSGEHSCPSSHSIVTCKLSTLDMLETSHFLEIKNVESRVNKSSPTMRSYHGTYVRPCRRLETMPIKQIIYIAEDTRIQV